MLFALTRSNLLRQLPDGNGIILRLTEIVTVSNSISPEADKSKHIFGNCYIKILQEKSGYLIWYIGVWMCSLLQCGQRPGRVKRFRFLKTKPQFMHCEGMIISFFFRAATERSIWERCV